MIPSALDALEDILRESAGRRVALFFDYDGTLTPIVARPELARMAPEMRAAVEALARLCPVAIVSGRDRPDVEALVQVGDIFYAGSHGFDIAGPGGQHLQQTEGEAFVPLLREAEATLREALAPIPGTLVESKRYAFAVHYRQVDPAHHATVEEAVTRVAGRYPRLRVKGGKMVHEVLPRMDWDKGKAVNWLLKALKLEGPEVLPFYLGDDLTDEDAFAVLAGGRGIGILVAEAPQQTRARFSLRDPPQVRTFCERFAAGLAGQAP